MSDYIEQVFGPGGCLAARFEGYTPRPAQVAFARAVDEAIETQQHLVGECPTGTGKSIGYGVPATYHAAHSSHRVLIVTANIALQEQLVTKDLPLLRDVLPWRFSFALMKGRSNFLCIDRMYQEEAEGKLELAEQPDDASLLADIVAWTRRTETGDVSELPFVPPHRLWRRFSTSSEDCKGSDCRFREECFAYKAREAAESAQVVVTNYSMLFSHLAVREATGQDLVLPPFDVAVLDEAHKAGDIARDFFGFRITPGAVRWAGRLLKKLGKTKLRDSLSEAADRFFDRLARYGGSAAYRARLRQPDPVPWSELTGRLTKAAETYIQASGRTDDTDRRAELGRAAARCTTLAEQIQAAMSLTDKGSVYFIEEDHRGGAVLCSKPIDVAPRLHDALFEPAQSVILTSATLTTGGRFDHIVSELGVPDPQTLVVDSPFTHEQQMLLVVPEGLPAPNDPDYSTAVADAVAETIELAGGRTLALFTSYRNLNATYERVAGNGFRVLRQGELPRTPLVEEFRRDVSSVLLGTESFWAGVDVPGEALSCVVIDRLPFPSPNDPVLDAISERDRGWFRSYSLPRAIISFKQGFGRLIRSASDRGVVVVLDQRLVSKPYGRLFVSSIPEVLKSRQIDNVRHFLSEAA